MGTKIGCAAIFFGVVGCVANVASANTEIIEIPYVQRKTVPKAVVAAPPFAEKMAGAGGGAGAAPAISQTSQSMGFSSLEEKVINGVTEFVVTRAKAEAALFFREQLKEDICYDNHLYLENLCVALDVGEMSMSLNSMGGYLRAAVKKDIEYLPDNVLAVVVSDPKLDANKKNYLIATRLIVPIYRAAREGRAPDDIIRGLSEVSVSDEGSSLLVAIKNASKLFIAFEKAVVYEDGQLANGNLATLISEINRAGIQGLDGSKLSAISENDLKTIRTTWTKINSLAEQIKKPVKLPNGDANYDPKLRLNERLVIMDEMINLMEEFVLLKEKLSSKDNTADLVRNFGELRKSVRMARELLKGDEAAYMTAFLSYAHQHKENFNIPEGVKRVIPVAIEIANAETSKDVAAVLETAAAPVGSYREKSKRNMSSVTAFLGTTLRTVEQYSVNGTPRVEGRNGDVFAPVGIHWTSKRKNSRDWFNYGGVYFSLIDLGPLVNTHSETGVESQPNIGFKQIFSPGLYITGQLYGPLNIGAGASKTPALIRSNSGNDITPWRAQIFLALDLTLLPF